MRRRKFLIGMSALIGGGAVVGSGAFSSVEAERTITVDVASDTESLLALDDNDMSPNGDLADVSGGTLEFDINDVLDTGGKGPGTDSEYALGKVFKVENQGTQTVYIEASFDGLNEIESIGFFAADNDEDLLNGEDAVAEIGVGETADMGVYVDTDGVDLELGEDREIDDITATITAAGKQPDDVEVVDDINFE